MRGERWVGTVLALGALIAVVAEGAKAVPIAPVGAAPGPAALTEFSRIPADVRAAAPKLMDAPTGRPDPAPLLERSRKMAAAALAFADARDAIGLRMARARSAISAPAIADIGGAQNGFQAFGDAGFLQALFAERTLQMAAARAALVAAKLAGPAAVPAGRPQGQGAPPGFKVFQSVESVGLLRPLDGAFLLDDRGPVFFVEGANPPSQVPAPPALLLLATAALAAGFFVRRRASRASRTP